MNTIKIGDILYKKVWNEIEEVEVIDIYLEAYVSGYKTMLMVKTKNGFAHSYFASDVGTRLLTELPKGGE